MLMNVGVVLWQCLILQEFSARTRYDEVYVRENIRVLKQKTWSPIRKMLANPHRGLEGSDLRVELLIPNSSPYFKLYSKQRDYDGLGRHF